MSTTNIDEQKMQQINSSDTITQFMEKCNNNFSNIFRYRSGPEGKQGVEGSQGVPTKPKVPIHVWREGFEYIGESILDEGYEINSYTEDLTNVKYQEGHLIMLKNGHVYILEEGENSTLKPNYIMALQSYNQDDVIDGRSAYIHIAYAISTNPYDGFITNEQLQESQKQGNVGVDEGKYKYMGLYSNYEEKPDENPCVYTWVRIVGDTGEKGDKGDKGDTPTSTSVEVVGYSLEDLDLDSKNWEKTISDLGELKPGTPIYILNKYTWDDGTVTYGKTVTMAGTQGIKGETGRVLFYLGSFEDGTLKKEPVKGLLNEYRCDYYIDATGQAWMRTGTSEIADGHMFGKDNIVDNWVPSDKVGFLQAGAISADMINTGTITANSALVTKLFAQDVEANNLKVQAANIQGTLTANKIKSGKISSTNEKSYFDLDTGEFVLGNNGNGGGALSYIDGKLHIGGSQNIGGRNLLSTTSYNHFYNAGDTVYFTKLMELESDKKYIATYGKFENNADGATNEAFNEVCLAIGQYSSLENIEKVVKFGEPFEVNYNGRELYIAWAISAYVDSVKGTSPNIETNTSFTQYLDQVMVQEGDVATAFQPSIDEELVEIEQAQENFQNSLNNINSDEYFSMVEKKNIRTDWETISGAARTTATIETYSSLNGNYGEAYRAAESSSIVTTDIDTAFISLRDYLNTHELYEDTDTSWGSTGRKTLAEKFTAYYNAESALWNAINNAYVDSKVFDDTAYSYLKKALANDTKIEGGLIATSQIQLRDWTGNYLSDGKTKEYKVNSGLSGIDNDNVLMWGGGTYEEAANAALADNDFHVGEKKTGRQITSLLKTDGTGKIGCFHIIDDNTIAVKSSDDNSDIVISAGENEKDTNIIINQDGDMKVLISGDNIEKNSIYGVELKGTYTSNENITASNQDIVVKEIEVPHGTGNWSVNFNAKKLMFLFGIAPMCSISGVSCSFNVYLCGKLIASGVWTKEDIPTITSYSQEVGGSVNLKSFTTAAFTNTDGQSTQTLLVKLSNVKVKRGSEWSTDYNKNLYLSSIRICTKTGDGTNVETDYEDDSILLTYVSSRIGIIQIGRNGIQVSHKNGGFVQILNNDSELYVRMFGLPTDIPTGNNIDGNIYNWNGFLRVAGNESTSKKSTTINFTEIGYKKVKLPSHVIIENLPHKTAYHEQNELWIHDDGDVFINDTY